MGNRIAIEFICDRELRQPIPLALYWSGRGRFVCRGGNHANNCSCLTCAGSDVDLCQCRCMVRELPTGRFKLRLRHASAMPGPGVGARGRMSTQSIPRDGLRDLCRELEYPRLAQALSARLLRARTHQARSQYRSYWQRGEATSIVIERVNSLSAVVAAGRDWSSVKQRAFPAQRANR